MITTGAGDTGRDYVLSQTGCTHAQYKKHLKQHIDSEAKAITEKLEEIYLDNSLTKEAKQKKNSRNSQ